MKCWYCNTMSLDNDYLVECYDKKTFALNPKWEKHLMQCLNLTTFSEVEKAAKEMVRLQAEENRKP